MDAILKFDYFVLDLIQNYMRCGFLDAVFVFFTRLGDGGFIWILLTLICLISEKYRKLGSCLAVSLVLCLLIGNEVLKEVFARQRPFYGTEISLWITPPGGYSFPSGHTMSSFADFVTRTPEEYAAWIDGTSREVSDFEVTELIRLSGANPGKKIIVDTNLSAELLHRLSDYRRVAVMLSPQSMSVERFFDRSDPEKQMMLSVLDSLPDPEAAHANWRECLKRVNSREAYDAWQQAGFFTLIREDNGEDTREAVLAKLAAHFGLED